MIITRELCDRCGKEIAYNSPLKQTGEKIEVRARKRAHLLFPEKSGFFQKSHSICDECYEQFIKWWKTPEQSRVEVSEDDH